MIPEIPTEPCPPEGGRYETVNGEPARVLSVDLPGDYPFCVAEKYSDSVWDGASYSAETFVDAFRPVRKPREWWVNIYESGFSYIHETRQGADDRAAESRAECILVREVLE